MGAAADGNLPVCLIHNPVPVACCPHPSLASAYPPLLCPLVQAEVRVADLATSEDMLRRQLLAERAAHAGEWGGGWGLACSRLLQGPRLR